MCQYIEHRVLYEVLLLLLIVLVRFLLITLYMFLTCSYVVQPAFELSSFIFITFIRLEQNIIHVIIRCVYWIAGFT